MKAYPATIRRGDQVLRLTVIAPNRWEAYGRLFDAAGDQAAAVRLQPPAPPAPRQPPEQRA